jgi:RNA polymerase sigma-70 factor (ECF subfamily)
VNVAAGSLVERCVAGEASAWRELHRTFYPTVRTFLRRMGVEGGENEDACQEVFVQVFRSLPRFEHRAELKTWLYRLCLTQASRARRRRALRLRVHLGALWGRPAEPQATQEWSEPQMGQRIGDALGRMKPHHREVFVLYELEALSGEEVAAILGCPEPTVWRRLHHARREFEALVTGAGAETKEHP